MMSLSFEVFCIVTTDNYRSFTSRFCHRWKHPLSAAFILINVWPLKSDSLFEVHPSYLQSECRCRAMLISLNNFFVNNFNHFLKKDFLHQFICTYKQLAPSFFFSQDWWEIHVFTPRVNTWISHHMNYSQTGDASCSHNLQLGIDSCCHNLRQQKNNENGEER